MHFFKRVGPRPKADTPRLIVNDSEVHELLRFCFFLRVVADVCCLVLHILEGGLGVGLNYHF